MGKPIIQRRRGKGSIAYTALSNHYKDDAKYMPYSKFNDGGVMQIIDIINDPARTAPLMEIMYEDFTEDFLIAPKGVRVGDLLEFGPNVRPKIGNVLPLKKVPEGTPVYNIEKDRGDGGKLVRTSGLSAYVVSHDGKKTILRLPSKTKYNINSECRATIGTVAGSGRPEKPFLKASNKHHSRSARGKEHPHVSRSRMNAIQHPFGGSTAPGRQTSSSRNAPPGAKVGNIAPRKTGRAKRVDKEMLND